MELNQNIKNYWRDIDIHLNDLIENGYCYLPPINNLFDNTKYFKFILKDTATNTYNENNKIHKNILHDYGFKTILIPKLYQLAKENFSFEGNIDNQYHIVRNVNSTQKSESYRGHFDSHIFTMILPMHIPKDEKGNVCGGDLVFFPNLRNKPVYELINIYQKIFYKKFNSPEGFRKLSKINKKITENFSDYRPLIFLGIQTLHGNLKLENDTRQTLLSHFFDPSPEWGIGSILRKIRNR
ncbi:MAG: hypothetical protein CML94_00515 [Rhodobiaceae bacterium]|nr:hypothetical protein [Rhodobiaceae bacterium]|tara:strand:- start:435 stop:1151 length:717 start_codon:yes stop_codon:yes gene_type:complete